MRALLGWFDDRGAKHAGDLTPGHRVGARHRKSGVSPTGGGYPDNCSYYEISKDENKTADVILAELQEMGLREDLLSVAEKVGADKFIQVWQFLDCHYDERGEGRGFVFHSLLLINI